MKEMVRNIHKPTGIYASASIFVASGEVSVSSSVSVESTDSTSGVDVSSIASVGQNLIGKAICVFEPSQKAGFNSDNPDSSPAKERMLWYHFAEGWVNPKSASALFLMLSISMFAGVIVYFACGKPRDAIEYASYVSPCCAAIIAGFAVYRDDLKGLLFLLSSFFLMLGVAAFLTIHSEKVLVRTWTTAALVVSANLIVFIMAGRAIAASQSKWREGMLQLLLLAPLVSITFYAVSFVYHNGACLEEQMPPGECREVWRFWTN